MEQILPDSKIHCMTSWMSLPCEGSVFAPPWCPMNPSYHDLWRQLGISHSDFIRTTEARHHRAVAEIIRRIEANGDLYVAKHEGWYCSSCETFYTEKELGAGRTCPVHESPTELQTEENVFFRLSKYQDRLLEWYSQPGSVEPESRRNEVRSFVESGLRDISVSRADLAWGVPFPGHDGQTVYVWLEALTNYLSVLGFGGVFCQSKTVNSFKDDLEPDIHLAAAQRCTKAMVHTLTEGNMILQVGTHQVKLLSLRKALLIHVGRGKTGKAD